MLDHVTLNVRDYRVSRRLRAGPGAAGFEVAFADDDWRMCGFGSAGKPYFLLAEREPPAAGAHVAFAAADRAVVDAFHAAALAAGGTDNGAPGLRGYHPNYYGAFVLDPDGCKAVCHRPEQAGPRAAHSTRQGLTLRGVPPGRGLRADCVTIRPPATAACDSFGAAWSTRPLAGRRIRVDGAWTGRPSDNCECDCLAAR